ncbi:tetratricopeptide repeat protein [candidate division WOR-3 bacterium]|nr:tetratricopeptide repeat protein [candidate division WOR-3 bacterium]
MKRLGSVFLLGLLLLACSASAHREPVKYSQAVRKYSSAFEYMKQGNYERARDLLKEAIEDSSTYVDAYIVLRKIYIKLDDIDKAIEICQEGLCCLPAEVEKDLEDKLADAKRKLTLALADLYAKTSQPEKATELFEKIIKDDPKDANSWDLYASYLQKQGQLDKAIEYYKKAYQYAPENKELAFRLGNAYFEAKQYKDAITLFSKSREVFPDDIDIMKKMAEAYVNLEEYNKAIEEYKAIIEKIPSHVSCRIKMGEAYKELRQLKKAKKYYLQALEIEPRNLSVYYHLINLEFERKNLIETKRFLNEALKINPVDPILLALHGEYYYRLGLVKMKEKKWNPSIERFEKAIAIWKKTISKADTDEWRCYAREGIQRAQKNIKEVKKVRW